MFIIKEKNMLLLRYSNYKSFNFLKEHEDVLKKNKCFWMMKVGKNIPEKKLEALYKQGGTLILRSPKSAGGKYYALNVEGCFIGEATENMTFPEYYCEMLKDENFWQLESLNGTWFKINKIDLIADKYIPHFYLISNGKKAEEVLSRTRSSMLYIKSDITIEEQA